MARLCVTYLAFPCFEPTLSDAEIQEHTRAGDYSFQEYATCNWIYHVESSMDILAENANEERRPFETSFNRLRKLHFQHSHFDYDAPENVDFVKHKAHVESELRELRKLYSIESISDETSNNGKPHISVVLRELM